MMASASGSAVEAGGGMPVRVVTWNVNGLAAVCKRHGLGTFLAQDVFKDADIVCLQVGRGMRQRVRAPETPKQQTSPAVGGGATQGMPWDGPIVHSLTLRGRWLKPPLRPTDARTLPVHTGDQAAAVRADC
jgi:hypothetical protein